MLQKRIITAAMDQCISKNMYPRIQDLDRKPSNHPLVDSSSKDTFTINYVILRLTVLRQQLFMRPPRFADLSTKNREKLRKRRHLDSTKGTRIRQDGEQKNTNYAETNAIINIYYIYSERKEHQLMRTETGEIDFEELKTRVVRGRVTAAALRRLHALSP